MLDESAIVYRDSYLLAVDKPAGIIVHGDGTGARPLADEVRELENVADSLGINAVRAWEKKMD